MAGDVEGTTMDNKLTRRDCIRAVALTAAPALKTHAKPVGEAQRKKLRVVVVGAHPDDPESGAGGLIAKLTAAGHDVILAYTVCFRDERKIDGRPEAPVRRQEAAEAAKILKAKTKFFPYDMAKFTADEPTFKEVCSWLNEVQPDIIVTHWPLDTHPNHHVTSSLVWQCFLRGTPWNLYFFEVMTGDQTLHFRPDLYLDIEDVREVKERALDCHQSQDPNEIWEVHEKMHRRRGAECGVRYAEAYVLIKPKPNAALLPVEFLSSDR